jgi:hypothetical protein
VTFEAHQLLFDVERQALEREFGPAVRSWWHLLAQSASEAPPPWKLEWCIVFPNSEYIYIREHYTLLKGCRLTNEGVRTFFSYHYGERPMSDSSGQRHYHHSNPTILRVCYITSKGKAPHLHYLGPDHHDQTGIKGFPISDAQLSTFVRAVLEHRSGDVPLSELLGFEIL